MNPDHRFVHFGDAEDILSSSFFMEDDEETECILSVEGSNTADIENRLQLALESDDVSMFKHLLVEIPDLVEKYLDKPIPHLAAHHGSLRVLQEFINKPADSINSATLDYDATTPLYWAIRYGRTDVVSWLLTNGAFHQPLNVYQDSAVYVAVKYGQYDLLPILKEHNCDFSTPNSDGDMPITYVVREGNSDGLDQLLTFGADMYAKTASRQTVIHTVLSCEYPKRLHMLQSLQSAGYNEQIPQHLLIALLLPALKSDDVNFLTTLTHHLTAIDLQQEAQEEAVERGSVKCLEYLIKEMGFLLSMGFIVRHGGSRVLSVVMRNASNDEVGEEGLSLVYECIQICWRMGGYRARIKGRFHHILHIEAEHKIQILLDHGVDIYKCGQNTQMSPLFFATKISMVCVVFWMLRAGVNPKCLQDVRTPIAAALNGMFAYFLNMNMIKMAYLWIYYLTSHNDTAITVYLKKTQHLDTSVNRSPQMASVMDDLRCLLIEKSSNPKRLHHLSRIVVLRSLGLNAHKKVVQIPIPKKLKEYVLLQDLEEMCHDINGRVREDQNYLAPVENASFCLCSPSLQMYAS